MKTKREKWAESVERYAAPPVSETFDAVLAKMLAVAEHARDFDLIDRLAAAHAAEVGELKDEIEEWKDRVIELEERMG